MPWSNVMQYTQLSKIIFLNCDIMRLFLASQDLGKFAADLKELVGARTKALIISNARDYYRDEARIEKSLMGTSINLAQIGIKSQRLDLREYFGKPDRLAQYITAYDPGLVFSIGGNVFCLATAMHESGMDKNIRQGLQEDAFVYGGYSAGSMITVDDLAPYDVRKESGASSFYNLADRVIPTYGIEPYTHGLDVIEQYILPHMDRADHIDTMKRRIQNIHQARAKVIKLNDSDVYMINNNKSILLKGAI